MRMGSSLDATTQEQSQAKILNEADAEPPILVSWVLQTPYLSIGRPRAEKVRMSGFM